MKRWATQLLALDLGTTLGWAARCGRRVFSGTVNLRGSRFEGGGMRYLRFRQWLEKMPAVARVAYEEVRRHRGVDAAHVYGGLQAELTAFCEERGIPYESVPVGAIKKYATGKGNADKEQMLAAARARWPGRVIADDNEADALLLLECVENE